MTDIVIGLAVMSGVIVLVSSFAAVWYRIEQRAKKRYASKGQGSFSFPTRELAGVGGREDSRRS